MPTEEDFQDGEEVRHGPRDRDPPPRWDGLNPEATFKAYVRDIQLWRSATDIEARKQGAKVLRALSGFARASLDDMAIEKITSDQGVDNILAALTEIFEPHLEQAMPRAFERAVCRALRGRDEGLLQYIVAQEQLFSELKREGVALPDEVKGYVLFRFARLSEAQEDMIKSWTSGSYGYQDIVKNLRKLEKV